MPEVIRYRCKKCGRCSGAMTLVKGKHVPTAEEVRKQPNICTEVLLCPCGEKNTWFTMTAMSHMWEGGKK